MELRFFCVPQGQNNSKGNVLKTKTYNPKYAKICNLHKNKIQKLRKTTKIK